MEEQSFEGWFDSFVEFLAILGYVGSIESLDDDFAYISYQDGKHPSKAATEFYNNIKEEND